MSRIHSDILFFNIIKILFGVPSIFLVCLYIHIYIFELLLFLYTPVAYLRELDYFQCIRTGSMPRRRVPLWREIFIPMVLCAL